MADLRMLSLLFAIAGDSFNTAGAFVLAWDVLGREREHNTLEGAIRFVKKLHESGSHAGVEDPEIALIREAVRLGRRGCVLIFLGFLLLVVHRGLELYDVTHMHP